MTTKLHAATVNLKTYPVRTPVAVMGISVDYLREKNDYALDVYADFIEQWSPLLDVLIQAGIDPQKAKISIRQDQMDATAFGSTNKMYLVGRKRIIIE